jgi:hypothetical protein
MLFGVIFIPIFLCELVMVAKLGVHMVIEIFHRYLPLWTTHHSLTSFKHFVSLSACLGSYGVNCTRPCPPGYCGRQCRTRCRCDDCDSHNCTCTDGEFLRQFSHLFVLYSLSYTDRSQSESVFDSRYRHRVYKILHTY